MTSKRKIKALEVMLNVKEHDLNAISQTLQALYARKAGYEREMHALAQSAKEEEASCPTDMRSYLIAYLQQISQRQAELTRLIEETDAEALALQDTLSTAFAAAKTSEHVLESAKAQRAQQQSDKLIAEQNDAALSFALNRTGRAPL